jgi:hypothetical protein
MADELESARPTPPTNSTESDATSASRATCSKTGLPSRPSPNRLLPLHKLVADRVAGRGLISPWTG